MAESAYHVAWQMTQNMDLMMRVAASAQQESGDMPDFDPEAWAREHKWEWATQSDWVAAVQSAMDQGITLWGSSPGVVTDQMILSWVQANMVAP